MLFFATSCYIYKPYTGGSQDVGKSNSKQQQAKSLREPKTDGNEETAKVAQDMTLDTGKSNPQADELKRKKEEEAMKMREEETRKMKEAEMGKYNEDEIRKKKEEEEQGAKVGKASMSISQAPADAQRKSSPDIVAASKNSTDSEKSTSGSLKSKIQPNKYYRIIVDEKRYKIQADKWEKDTLVCHIIRKPKKVLRFSQNQIDEESLEERRFSKPYSDIITISSYVATGVAVLLLIL